MIGHLNATGLFGSSVILLHLHCSRIDRLLPHRCRIRLLPSILPLLASATLMGMTTAADSNAAPVLSHQACMAQLDASVALASNRDIDSTFIDQQLEALEDHCIGMPQIAHNRGVLAARNDDWPQAINHFKRSLQQDSRASMTHRHMQQIFEHRAAVAYSKALNTPVDVPAPTFNFQSSATQNADVRRSDDKKSTLHDIATIEYELFAWWQAQQNSIGLNDFYVDDFPATAIRLAQRTHANKQWQDMHREIAFTARDAVVVISDAYHHRTLLLLRLVGNRWKIYQETNL